jgi:hypothetical protein
VRTSVGMTAALETWGTFSSTGRSGDEAMAGRQGGDGRVGRWRSHEF